MSDWGEVWMTPEQLGALGAELLEVIRRHVPDPAAERPAGARQVLIQFQTLPMLETPVPAATPEEGHR
jgi:hypothetical protein